MKIDKAKFLAVAVALLLSVTLVGGATGLFVLDESRTIKVMAPTVVETRYYLVGSMNSWTENESWRLTQSGNAYVLNNKSMAGGATFKIKKVQGSAVTWYNTMDTSIRYAQHSISGTDQNIAVKNSGTYTIKFVNNKIQLTGTVTYTFWFPPWTTGASPKYWFWCFGNNLGGEAKQVTSGISGGGSSNTKIVATFDAAYTGVQFFRCKNTFTQTTGITWQTLYNNAWNYTKDNISLDKTNLDYRDLQNGGAG